MHYAEHKYMIALRDLLIQKGIITEKEFERAVLDFEIRSEELARFLSQGVSINQ